MQAMGVLAHDHKTLGAGLGEFRRRLGARLAELGHTDTEIHWGQVRRSKAAPKHVERMLDEGIDRLIVWGGDGTVRRCIDTVVGLDADVELAIMPAGTANLLAHGLDIPIDLDAALDVALTGHPRRIDVGQMNGESFAVMAGAGFDALLIRDADSGKERFGRVAYLAAGAKHFGRSDHAGVQVTVDGERWYEGPAACVLVGNFGRILGGVEVFPDACADDGRLDVGIVTAKTRRDWLRIGARAVTGRIDNSKLVEVTQGRRIKVRLDHMMPWELDGGDRPKAKKFTVSVLPQRMPVCVPSAVA
jgi:YegS/Rv2252/BmrU family lipid kinase